MKYLRFPLFLTVWMTGLGMVPMSLSLPAAMAESTQLLAQAAKPSSTAKPVAKPVVNNSAYNQYMQAGYEATQQKDFVTAKEQFQKALTERPQDIYAQQALQNIDIYSSRSSNPLVSFLNSPLGLVLGLIAVLAGMGVAFWLFFRTLSSSKAPKTLLKGDLEGADAETIATLEEPISKRQDPAPSASTTLENPVEAPLTTQEEEFPIQTTTRIKSPELLDTLVAQLHDPSPQVRRKAIWELAQKADSRAMKPLVELMVDSDSQDHGLILEALSQIGTRSLKPLNQALTISLQDKNPQVRKNAIRDLTRIYDVMSQISQMLCYVLEDSDSEVKETAKWAIDQLNIQMPHRLDLHARPPQGPVTVEQSYAESGE